MQIGKGIMDKKDIIDLIINELNQIINKNGQLTEDEIIDLCIDYDLDIVDIDYVCEKILNTGIRIEDNDEDNDIYDRSHVDYDIFFTTFLSEYPSWTNYIEQIRQIKPPQHKEWYKLIKEAQQGDEKSRERLILMYIRTAIKQAYDFSKTFYVDFEEAYSYAVMGLILAVDKYDITSPSSFGYYYPLWMRNQMQRFCEVKHSLFRLPAHYKDGLFSFVSSISRYIENDDIENTLNLIDEEDSNYSYLKYLYPFVEIPEEYEMEFDEEEDFDNKELREILEEAMTILTEKERKVLQMRYGLDDGREKTLEEVGEYFSVTRERIRQIEAKALRKLRYPRIKRQIEVFL